MFGKSLSLSLALAALLAIGVPVAYGGIQPSGPGPAWAELAPVPSVGSGVEGMSVAGVTLAGLAKIAAAQGLDSLVGDTATTRIYDIATNVWTFGADAPFTNSEGTAVSQGNLLYALGGRVFEPGSAPRADLISYNIASNSWTVLAPMPTPRAGLGAAVVGDAIFAIGGRSGTGGPDSGGALAVVERYNITTNAWTTVAPLPFPRSDCAAISVGGKIFVIGGFNGAGVAINNVDVYNPVTNSWSSASPMPTARGAFYQVANKGNVIYAIGGTALTDFGLTTNEAFDVAKNSWTTGLLLMPDGRGEAGAVQNGAIIYIVGGSHPAFGASDNANEAFKP